MDDYYNSEAFRVRCEEAQLRREQECRDYEERAKREAESKVYPMSAAFAGLALKDVSGRTPEQRLAIANSCSPLPQPKREIQLTQEDRHGLTEEAFLALSPDVRLQMYNEALDRREKAK